MANKLVIVESPAKAKTIEKFLDKDYIVKSSIGHIRDLPKSGMSIDIENGFIPKYEIYPDKEKTVNELKKLAKSAEMVLLATDEDREGEAIAWHLFESLELKKEKTQRIVFHEITKKAILHAIDSPRQLDTQLVDAQQARRVLDRLVGYELSPVLWKKVKPNLSAGRVQSVTVRLIVEREREIIDFVPNSSFKINAILNNADKKIIKVTLPKNLQSEEETLEFLNEVIISNFRVAELTKTPGYRKPAPPFTTSTLQQEAGRKLGYSVKQTMVVAQKLYESGQITYMRTDSVNLSEFALSSAKDKIEKDFGSNFHQRRTYATKTANAQEAHEAIRPTDFNREVAEGDSSLNRLYQLIWKRALASQMADAKLEKTNVKIDISKSEKQFVARGEVVTFEGFLKLYMESIDDDDENEEGIIPPLKVNEELDLSSLSSRQTYTKPPARYTESSLVKRLEELGIGRPSTYAPTISTIQDREYVVKEDREGKEREFRTFELKDNKIISKTEKEIYGNEKQKLFPTDIGKIVNDFLVKYFDDIVDFQFTAKVEEEFDEISRGEKNWKIMLQEFYSPFHDKITKSDDIKRSEAVGSRELGLDPKTGRRVFARLGRFGPIIQVGETEDEEKPVFANIPSDKSIDTIELEEALDLITKKSEGFNSNAINEWKEQGISVLKGRFGPYITDGTTNVTVPKGKNPTEITLEDAQEMIKNKKEGNLNNIIQEWKEKNVQVLKGRFGPYITDGKKNAKIPKDIDPKDLKLEECLDLLEKAPAKKPVTRRGKK